MAKSAIAFVVQNLSDLIVQKAVSLKGVEGQVEWLRDELLSMKGFLKDADAKQEEDERVKHWVSEIRNAAYEAEDIIDTFILKIESQKNKGFFQRYPRIFRELNDRRKVGKDIKSLKNRLLEICGRHERYGIRSIGEVMTSSTAKKARLRHLRHSSPLCLDKDLVGFQKNKDELVAQLIQKEDQFIVISIVGMPGIGKTTLARRVFTDDLVRVHFDFQAWVFVSQDCRPIEVLQTIIRQVTGKSVQSSQEEELETMLYEHLQEKCYLVVLDDIWSIEAWDVIKRAFPRKNNGSKLLLTTRNKDVALNVAQRADARSVFHKLELLSKENSWELFSRKAFIDEADTSCPLELEEVAREIVGKCRGLPLAIIVFGGLLSRKRLVSEWMRVLTNIDSLFAKDENGVLPKLALSYSDLPHYLKSCFLHLGLFPEDYVISTKKLFQLWIAEGLIPEGEERMESIAEDYLNELAHRHMVQVVRTSANNRIKECQIHDLLRELSIRKAKEEIFLEIHGKRNFAPPEKTRHLAIYWNFDRYFHSKPSIPQLRSLLLFDSNDWKWASSKKFSIRRLCSLLLFNSGDWAWASSQRFSQLNIICLSFKLLRVLDLEHIPVGHLPSEIGRLINLKYLGLRSTRTTQLPSSMKYLQSLQTLDISGSNFFHKIPNVICKMKNLRHLYKNSFGYARQVRIDTLMHLQTLSWVHVDDWKQINSENLMSLLKLGVMVHPTSDVDRFLNSIAKLELLLSLYLVFDNGFGNYFPSLIGLSHLHCLAKLRMMGAIKKLPRPHEFPPNLTQLTLIHSHLNQSAMNILKELPKLSILILRDHSYVGEQLKIAATWFPRLHFLELQELRNLEELILENGAIPRIRRIRILSCKKLTKFHSDWAVMNALQELEIVDTGLRLNEASSGVGIYESSPSVGDQ